MASIELQTDQLRDFVSDEVAGPETTDVDLERFKRQVETYLNDLRRALVADLQTICETCCPSSP